MKAKRKPATRRRPVRRGAETLKVSVTPEFRRQIRAIPQMVGAAMDKAMKAAFSQPAKLRLPAAKSPASGPRYINLDASGKPTSGDHVFVQDNETGLIWLASPLQDGKEMNHADAVKACAALDLLGKSDWRLPTVDELLGIIDRSRVDPASDPNAFKGPYDWTWSSTPYAGNPSGYAWYVSLHDGYCYWGSQSCRGRVRAVRAGQQLGLSV